MPDLIILGTGGNAIDIAEAVMASGRNGENCRVLGFLDDNQALWGKTVAGRPILGGLGRACDYPQASFVNGIGSPENFWRKPEIIARTGLQPDRFATVIHPQAWVSPTARLGHGVVVLANASICAGATLGNHVIVLPNAVVSHDDVIGDYTCIASGACISGNVTIGGSSYIGTRSTVRGHVKIGSRALIGIGSVVLNDVADNRVVIGSPARFHRFTIPSSQAA